MSAESSALGGNGPSPAPARPYGLALTEGAGAPHPDAAGITEALIRDVVVEFYRRARGDAQLGPVFERRIHDWDLHLGRMVDFWSAALLRSGRYAGRPVERHRSIAELQHDHFDRWIDLFEATVYERCTRSNAEAFLSRARRMRDGMTKCLGLSLNV